jgi:uncharacterized membrane protein YhiD involved in acid resistance
MLNIFQFSERLLLALFLGAAIGIGFLGAGVIMKDGMNVRGLNRDQRSELEGSRRRK